MPGAPFFGSMGLLLALNVSQNDYMHLLSPTAGFRVTCKFRSREEKAVTLNCCSLLTAQNTENVDT